MSLSKTLKKRFYFMIVIDIIKSLYCHWPWTPSIVLIINPVNSNCTVSNWVKESEKGWKNQHSIDLSPVHPSICLSCPSVSIHQSVYLFLILSPIILTIHLSLPLTLSHSLSLSLSLSLSYPSIIDLIPSLSMDWEKNGKRIIFRV